jgi:hypothetical protein
MPQESTIIYNMENWREATKNWTFTPYFTEEYEIQNGLSVNKSVFDSAITRASKPIQKERKTKG